MDEVRNIRVFNMFLKRLDGLSTVANKKQTNIKQTNLDQLNFITDYGYE